MRRDYGVGLRRLEPRAEPRAFAHFEAIERNERETAGALRQSEALRQAILSKAFTGRLGLQTPADEPDSTRLARLCTERDMTAQRSRTPSAPL